MLILFRTYILLLLLSGLSITNSLSQDKYRLIIYDEDLQDIDTAGLKELFIREVKGEKDLGEFMLNFYESGYLLASYEIIREDSLVEMHIGPQFRWAELDPGDLPLDLQIRAGIKPGFFEDGIFNFKKLTSQFKKIIDFSENRGYPFAKIKLSDVRIEGERLRAEVDYDPGPMIRFSGLKLNTEDVVKVTFLENYLNIHPGNEYKQMIIDRISYSINQLPYLRLQKPPELIFRDQECEVSLQVQAIQANTFDGIIGFLPNENDRGRLLVTGQVELYLHNLFKSGKHLGLEWQKPNLLTQELFVDYSHPVFFGLPFDLSTSFSLFKQDTSFINRELSAGLRFDQYPLGKFGLDYQLQTSRLLSTPMPGNNEALRQIDFNINYYGVSFQLNTLNEPFFPTKGMAINSSIQAGSKSLLKNTGIDQALYDSFDQKTLQWRITLDVEKFTPIARYHIIVSRIYGGYLHGKHLFLNDMFRLGGLGTIRGFNEKYFFASRFLSGTLEYRYLFENESQLVAFFDSSWLGYDLPQSSYRDFPVGFGAGFSLSTRAGLLNIFYAMGTADDQPLGFSFSKIHIGYSNKF